MTISAPASTILLYGRSYFDLLNPAASQFHLSDIARGLSHVCRFAGQCPTFYSVAEHSVHVSRLVPPEDAWAGLMHDAAEAFIGDIAKPLKRLLPDYAVVEERVERAVFARFNVPFPLPPSIKQADRAMLAAEQRQLWQNHDHWKETDAVAPADVKLWCLPADKAKIVWETRAGELLAQMAARSHARRCAA